MIPRQFFEFPRPCIEEFLGGTLRSGKGFAQGSKFLLPRLRFAGVPGEFLGESIEATSAFSQFGLAFGEGGVEFLPRGRFLGESFALRLEAGQFCLARPEGCLECGDFLFAEARAASSFSRGLETPAGVGEGFLERGGAFLCDGEIALGLGDGVAFALEAFLQRGQFLGEPGRGFLVRARFGTGNRRGGGAAIVATVRWTFPPRWTRCVRGILLREGGPVLQRDDLGSRLDMFLNRDLENAELDEVAGLDDLLRGEPPSVEEGAVARAEVGEEVFAVLTADDFGVVSRNVGFLDPQVIVIPPANGIRAFLRISSKTSPSTFVVTTSFRTMSGGKIFRKAGG